MSSPSPSTTPSPPATNTTSPPPSTPSAPPPSTPSAPPPSTPAAPPPATPSAPPPETPSPPPPATPSPPPPATPSPPPTTPSAPPPATPSAPPPATPSAPPPSTPSTPPSTPSTPPTSTPSPPPPSAPSPPSPPPTGSPPSPPTSSPPPPSSTNLSPPPPKTPSPPPPPSASPPSSDSLSTGVIAGVAIGGVAILLVLSLLFVCYSKRRKRRRNDHGGEQFYIPRPPPAPGPKDGYTGGATRYWQQNNPTPADQYMMPMPNRPQTPPPPVTNSSGGSGSNYSGSDGPIPTPSPGMALGFSKNAFTFEELSMATGGFSDANLLGQGGFGYVHKGFLSNGKEVAVKSLKAGSGQGEREFHAEVEIISRVHHKHLVSLVGYCISGSQRLLVYEFVPNNNLEFHLHGKDRPTVDWPSRLKIAMGSAKGLAYLHEDCHPKIIHRDIKASNILLDFKFEAKVADFGLAKLVPDVNTHISTRVMGTFGYLAPEYASSGKLTEKSDVFSFGVVLLELITGRRPIDNTDSYMAESLVDWARPMLNRAMEDDSFDSLADPNLQKSYKQNEMARMVACAAACVRHSARRRPKMSQVVRTLEGDVSLSDLNEGIRPGHSALHGSYGSSDYDSGQYNDEMTRFRQMAFAGQGLSSSEHGGATSDYGLNPSGSSSEGQAAREAGVGRIKGDGRGFSGTGSS